MSAIRFQCVTYASRAEAQAYHSKLLHDAQRYGSENQSKKAENSQRLADQLKVLIDVRDPSWMNPNSNSARVVRRGLRLPIAAQALLSLQFWRPWQVHLGAGRSHQNEAL